MARFGIVPLGPWNAVSDGGKKTSSSHGSISIVDLTNYGLSYIAGVARPVTGRIPEVADLQALVGGVGAIGHVVSIAIADVVGGMESHKEGEAAQN